MAFIEHSVVLHNSDSEIATANVMNFLTNTLGMTQDNEDNTIFWVGDSKTVGLKISVGSSAVSAVIYTVSGTKSDSFSLSNSSLTTYWQMSKDKDVIYIRSSASNTSTIVPRILFAKSDNGDWCAFVGNYMYHKNGRMFIGSAGTAANSNTPFSAVKMPNLAAGGNFLNLYKILSATLFSMSATYINFGGEAYRGVCASISSASSSDVLINYAFPVVDET